MDLFIRVVDGKPFEHPIMGDNFRAAFPDIDIDNLPPEFARFERIAPPPLGVYEVYAGAEYVRVGDRFADSHKVRAMTAKERAAKQAAVKAAWEERGGFASWVFDEETCAFKAPVAHPADGKPYRWDEQNLTWVEMTSTEVPNA